MKDNYKKREQIYIDENVIEHDLNKGKNLILGWTTLSQQFECETPEPQPPKGEIGYYSCIGSHWVWFPG